MSPPGTDSSQRALFKGANRVLYSQYFFFSLVLANLNILSSCVARIFIYLTEEAARRKIIEFAFLEKVIETTKTLPMKL